MKTFVSDKVCLNKEREGKQSCDAELKRPASVDGADLDQLIPNRSEIACFQLKRSHNALRTMTSRGRRLAAASVLMIVVRALSVQTLTCGGAEYQIMGQCCPMCPTGSRVETHCTAFRSTFCRPCLAGTFMDKHNGLTLCFPCATCDPGSGLKVKQPCTITSDTVCEPMEGFFCIDYTTHGCAAAQKHRSCEPGQHIREKGTASADTECSDCRNATVSNGTTMKCEAESQQELLQLTQDVDNKVQR